MGSLQHLHSVSMGPAPCRWREEWLSRVQRRAVVDESRASLARRGGCGVPCPAQFTLLRSLNLCVPHQQRQFYRGCLEEQGFLKCVMNFREGRFTYLTLYSLAGT